MARGKKAEAKTTPHHFRNNKVLKYLSIALMIVVAIGILPAFSLFAMGADGENNDPIEITPLAADGFVSVTFRSGDGSNNADEGIEVPEGTTVQELIDGYMNLLPSGFPTAISNSYYFLGWNFPADTSAIINDGQAYTGQWIHDIVGGSPSYNHQWKNVFSGGNFKHPTTGDLFTLPSYAQKLEFSGLSINGQACMDYAYLVVDNEGNYSIIFLVTSEAKDFLHPDSYLKYADIDGVLIADVKIGDEDYAAYEVELTSDLVDAINNGSLTRKLYVMLAGAPGQSINGVDLTFTNLRYRILHYIYDDDPSTATLYRTTPGTGSVGDPINAIPINIYGYNYTDVPGFTVDAGVIPPTGVLELSLYYQRDTNLVWLIDGTGLSSEIEYDGTLQSLEDAAILAGLISSGDPLYEISWPNYVVGDDYILVGTVTGDNPSGTTVGVYDQTLGLAPGFQVLYRGPKVSDYTNGVDYYGNGDLYVDITSEITPLLVFKDGALTITPRPITITVDDKSKNFGSADPAFTGGITLGTLVNSGDLGTLTFWRTNALVETPGVYTDVLVVGYTANSNYAVTVELGEFKINAVPITVDFTATGTGGFQKYYGNSDTPFDDVRHYLQEEVDNFLSLQNLPAGTIVVSVTGRAPGEDVVGSPYAYTVTWENAPGAVYEFDASEVYIAADLTIIPRPITITVNNSSKNYGGPEPTFTGGITLNTLVNSGDLGTISYFRTNASVETPGVYTGVLDVNYTPSTNYDVTVVKGTFTIRASSINVDYTAASSLGYFKVYGEADPALATVQADLQALVDSQLMAQGLNAGDIVVTVTDRDAGENVVGSPYDYKITWANAAGSSYTFTASEVSILADLTITPRPVTITVDDAAKDYGDPDPAFTGSITLGTLVAAGDLGTINYIRTNATVETPGVYPDVLDATYTANTNYDVTVVKGTFTIRAETITVDLTAAALAGYTKVYGEADPALATVQADLQAAINTQLVAQGLNAGDIVVTVTSRAAGENVVGSPYAYNITWANAAGSSYTFTNSEVSLAADLTITPRRIVITVDDAAKLAGDPDPAFTGSITSGSLVAAGDLGTITYSRTNATVNTPGTYPGVLTASYTANANYTVTVVPGTFTIKASTITVNFTAAASAGYAKVYGAADPTLASVQADLQAAVNAQLVAQGLSAGSIIVSVTGRAAGETVASSPYAYTITWANAAGSSYTFVASEVSLAADLTITQRPVTITVANATKVAGTADPAFSGSITSGSLAAAGDLGTITYYRTNATVNAAGTYTGVITANFTANTNYAVTVVPGTFTITSVIIPPPPVTGAIYTVIHYNGENGTILLTETLIGTVGATVTAIPQSFDGYAYNPADGRQVLTGVVLANGSLVLRVYYVATPNHVPVIPPTPIPPEQPPLAAPTAAWALVNLILSIVGILLALGLFIAYFMKHTKEEEHDGRRDQRKGHKGYDEHGEARAEAREEARSKRMVWRIVTLVAGILAIILFFLTEDMTLPMGLVDYWTIAHVIIFILQIVFMVLATKRKREEEEEDVHDRPKYAGSPAL